MGIRVVALLLPLLVTACPKYGTADASAPAASVAGTVPDAEPATASLQLESLYLNTNVRFTNDAPPAHAVSLTLSGRTGSTLVGRLVVDPNTCSLNVFGDREACTRIAVWGFDVELQLVRMIDPGRMGRRYYEVSGEGLSKDLALIVRGDLEAGKLEQCYLKLGAELVPLYVEAQQ